VAKDNPIFEIVGGVSEEAVGVVEGVDPVDDGLEWVALEIAGCGAAGP